MGCHTTKPHCATCIDSLAWPLWLWPEFCHSVHESPQSLRKTFDSAETWAKDQTHSLVSMPVGVLRGVPVRAVVAALLCLGAAQLYLFTSLLGKDKVQGG